MRRKFYIKYTILLSSVNCRIIKVIYVSWDVKCELFKQSDLAKLILKKNSLKWDIHP